MKYEIPYRRELMILYVMNLSYLKDEETAKKYLYKNSICYPGFMARGINI